MTHALVLLSGGLDSTTVATHALRDGRTVRALCVRYGQLHEREAASAAAVAGCLGIPLDTVDASFYRELAWNSSLMGLEVSALPAHRDLAQMAADIPTTYVPIRNTFFITLAAAALESWMLALIERDGIEPGELRPAIYLGANAIDYSGYPDCRPEFYEVMQEVLLRGSKLGSQYGVPIRLETPIIGMGKADIVRYGLALGAPMELTWSCYAGERAPCGRCDSCLLRAAGFAEAGISDPALAGN